jgi:hypothetical protein
MNIGTSITAVSPPAMTTAMLGIPTAFTPATARRLRAAGKPAANPAMLASTLLTALLIPGVNA